MKPTESRSDVDGVGDDLNDERILESSPLEVLSSVVLLSLVIYYRSQMMEYLQKMKLTPVNCCNDCNKHPVNSRLPNVPWKHSMYVDLPSDIS